MQIQIRYEVEKLEISESLDTHRNKFLILLFNPDFFLNTRI